MKCFSGVYAITFTFQPKEAYEVWNRSFAEGKRRVEQAL